MGVTEVAYGQFDGHLRRTARRARHPVNALFELTPTCNLRCRFCYVALDPYKGPYLSTDQIKQVLDTLARAGTLWLTLTGGEILSRRDFPEIYRHAKAKGFLVTLFTNATMVNERTAALLRELPPFSVEVSLYGHNAELYESVTQIPGSFARFERGITLLQEAEVPLILKMPVSTMSQGNLKDLTDYCVRRGVKFKIDLTLDARHDGGEQPLLYRIESKKIPKLMDEMDVINYGAVQELPPLPECSAVSEGSEEELYRCGAGRTGIFIDALGNASHCVIDRDPAFPILEMDWDELWARMGEWVTQPLPEDAPCSGCGLRKHCGNCPARSRLATTSPYLKDPYYCDVTHERFGLEPVKHPDYRAVARQMGGCVA